MKKIRLYTVRTLTGIAAVCFILCACCIDSESSVPFVVCLISAGWLGLILWANFDSLTGKSKKPKRKKPPKIEIDPEVSEVLSYD